MNKKRPFIAVTGPDRGGLAAWWFTKLAVWMQGGKAIRVQPKKGIPEVELHGLIIGGGADIHPGRYTESTVEEWIASTKASSKERHWLLKIGRVLLFPFIFFIRKLFTTKSPQMDEGRDELEFALLKQALQKGWPVLGICRGAQLINIHCGGTLHQDIANFYTETPKIETVWPKKRVKIAQDSRLFHILEVPSVLVNALHNQAVDELGKGIRIVGREETGIIQAIEYQHSDPLILGVQWHPEYLPQLAIQRRIFQELVKEAKHSSQWGERGQDDQVSIL